MDNTAPPPPPPPPPPSLLLLPVPTSWKRAALRTACGPTLSNVLPLVAKAVHGTNHVARLDIAVVLPESIDIDIRNTPRATLFSPTHTLLKELYSLLCVIAVEDKVELDFPGGVDARIVMLEAIGEGTPADDAYSGPLLNVSTLVSARRPYEAVFSVESEQGEQVLQAFLQLHSTVPNPTPPHVRRIIGGTSMTTPVAQPPPPSPGTDSTEAAVRRHYSVAVGGTFDHLHIGHKLLLTTTALVLSPSSSDRSSPTDRLIVIGITGDELLVNKKVASEVEPWDLRQKRTAEFFESIFAFPAARDTSSSRMTQQISRPGPNGHLVRVTYLTLSSGSTTTIDYTRISDPYGPTITNEKISALVVSAETRAGGKAVNDKRAEKGWAVLDVFEVDVLDAQPGPDEEEQEQEQEQEQEAGDTGGGGLPKDSAFAAKISSTEIRQRLAELKRKGDSSQVN